MRSTRTPGMKLSATRPGRQRRVRGDAEQRVGGIAPPRRQRDRERHGQRRQRHPGHHRQRGGERQRHAEERGMRRGVAEVGHAPPDHEAAERPRRQRHADPRQQRRGRGSRRGGSSRRTRAHASWSCPWSRCVVRRGMLVVVVVPVERQRPLGAEAEERAIFRRRRDHRGRALAADVAVEADHPVRRRHHHVQVVADHQHARSRARRGSARSAGRSAPRPAGRGPAPPRRARAGPAAAAAPAPAAPAGTGRPRAPPAAARRGPAIPTRSSACARRRASPSASPRKRSTVIGSVASTASFCGT